jgi:hypothetical protein
MNVYHLRADAERYQSLALLSEDERPKIEDRFDTSPIGDVWVPPGVEIVYRDALPTDYATLAAVPAFSARAVDVLRHILEPHGELLPLEGVDFYLFNVTTAPDALDEQRSELKRFASTGRIMRIVRAELRPEALAHIPIFKLPQQPRSRAYVTDEFVARCQDEALAGFDFSEIVWSG